MAQNKFDKALKEALSTIEKIKSEMTDIDKKILSAAKNVKQISGIPLQKGTAKEVTEKLQRTNNIRQQTNNVLKEQKQLEDALIRTINKKNLLSESTNRALQRERVETSIINKKIKEQAELSSKLVGEYRKQSIVLNQLRARYKDMALRYGENSKQAKKLLGDVTKLDAKLKRIDANVGQFGRSVGNYGMALRSLGGIARSVASAFGLMSGAFLAVQIFKNGVNRIREFDKEMQNMAGIVRGTRDELKDVEEVIIDVAANSTKTSNEVAKLATSLFTLGKTKDEVKLLIKPVNDLSIALNATSDETGEFLVQTLNSFGKGAESAEEFADQIATIRTSTSLDFQKMKDSFQYLSPISRALGKDLAYTGAVIGILADNGLKAQQAGRLLGSAQQRLAKNNMSLLEALKEVNKAREEGKSKLEVLSLAAKLFGIQAGKVGVVLAENTDKIEENAQAIRDNGGALQDLIDQQLTSLDAKIQILNSSYEKFLLTLDNGEGKITKTFNGAIWLGQDFFNTLSNINASGEEFYEWGKKAAKLEFKKSLKKDVDNLNISVEEAAKRKIPDLIESVDKYNKKLEELTLKQREAEDSYTVFGAISDAALSQNIKHTRKAIGKFEEMLALAREAAGMDPLRPGFIGPVKNNEDEKPFSFLDYEKDSKDAEDAIDKGRTYADVLKDIKEQQDLLKNSTKDEAKAILNNIDKLEKEKEAWERNKQSKKKAEIVLKGSSDALKKIISELEDERDRLATTAEEREKYNKKIEDAETKLWKLVEAQKALKEAEKTYGGDFSSEGTAAGKIGSENDINSYQQHLRDMQDAADKEVEIEKDKQDALAYLRELGVQNVKDLNDKQVEAVQDAMKLQKDLEESFQESKKDLIYSAFESIGEARVQDVEDDINENRRRYSEILANEELTQEQRSDIEAKRDQREAQLQKKKEEREKQAFLIKQGLALADIAINLAKSIAAINAAAAAMDAITPFAFGATGAAYRAANLPIAIGTAALQTGVVLAQTLPKFKDGHLSGTHEGLAMVNDASGSNYKEVVEDPKGNVFLPQERNQLIDMKRGTKVYKNYDQWIKKNNYQDLVSASIMTSLADQSQRLSQREAASHFDRELKKQITSGIKEGFENVSIHNHNNNTNNNDRLASMLDFERRKNV